MDLFLRYHLHSQVLLRNLEEFEIPYTGTILGFSDSLLASRALYPDTPSHKLSAMLEVGKEICSYVGELSKLQKLSFWCTLT